MMKYLDQEFNLMLIDDDKDDIQLLVELINEYNPNIVFTFAYDGEEAIEYLDHQLYDENFGKIPNLIFLDINMPRKNGLEFIREIKDRKELYRIPIIVFSSSKSSYDIEESYRLGASCYLVKPLGYNDLKHLVKVVGDFWFHTVEYIG